jgi:hypothetical protein
VKGGERRKGKNKGMGEGNEGREKWVIRMGRNKGK